MIPPARRCLLLVAVLLLLTSSFASVYNAHPKLVVILIVDQFRGDYLERYHDEFQQGGFRLLMEHGAWFTDCNLEYANTRTGPGHATIGTGAYTIGHGILSNEWWDDTRKRLVPAVEDDGTHLVGTDNPGPGASPHNLLATTLGDELRMATQGLSRVYGISLKDRAAILSTGFSANAAYWVDYKSGNWVTSTYYMEALPPWVAEFNSAGNADKYRALAAQASPEHRSTLSFEELAATPYANDFELDFARALISHEKLGDGAATDLLVVSLSANDVLGHRAGPDTPEMRHMALALDRQLAAFFSFLDTRFGRGNVWIAMTADHGISPAIPAVKPLRIPAQQARIGEMKEELNKLIATRTGRPGNYVAALSFPLLYLSSEAFGSSLEADAEQIAGEALVSLGMRGYFTKSDLKAGRVPPTFLGRRFLNSYSPYGGWYVLGLPAPFSVPTASGASHALPYNYDTHVPLAFYGGPFRPGIFREPCEPIDLAVTLAVLLGTNRPSSASGRVLTEALRPESAIQAGSGPTHGKGRQTR